VKADGKPWRGPREIRNLRWEGGKYSSQNTAEAALRPEEFQKNFDGAIRKAGAQDQPEDACVFPRQAASSARPPVAAAPGASCAASWGDCLA